MTTEAFQQSPRPSDIGIVLRVSPMFIPDSFDKSRIIYHDLDGTCFDTFTPNGGKDVEAVYEMAVEAILGQEALSAYNEAGGLKNRAPMDVIVQLHGLGYRSSPSIVRKVIEQQGTAEYSSTTAEQLVGQYLRHHGEIEPSLVIRAITEALVITKKMIIMPQIGVDWPIPEPGFGDYWQVINSSNAPVQVNWLTIGASEYRSAANARWERLHSAIASSGHTSMIRAFLANVDLVEPDMYVTDDEIRQHPQPRTKPDPLALQLASRAWADTYGALDAELGRSNGRQLHIGDDPRKDGGMAIAHGVAFVHYQRETYPWPEIQARVTEAVIKDVCFADVV